ncbi:hypothetical protein ACFL6T_03170 [Candidatus Zixiibacteriota bacterium]
MTGTSVRSAHYRRQRLTIIWILSIAYGVIGSGIQAQDVTVHVIEEPYQDVYAFLGVYFESFGAQEVEQGSVILTDTNQLGMGIRLMSARRTDVQFESSVGWRTVDLRDLGDPERTDFLDIFIGARYWPLYNTFWIGDMAIRLTVAGRGGLVMGNQMTGGVEFSGGFTVSKGRSPSALCIEAVFRPVEYIHKDIDEIAADVYLRPSWTLRIGFQFGPT